MKATHHITLTKLSIAALLAATAFACGGDNATSSDEAFLSIVGDTSVRLDKDASRTLKVRYHDGNDEPLAGEVTFAINGSERGSTISATAGTTDSQGVVELTLRAGSEDASFRIEASAEGASTAWTVTVGESGPRPTPTTINGKYNVETALDLTANVPGGADGVVGMFLSAGDDPGRWLLEMVVEETGAPSFLVGLGSGLINDLIEDQAPELVGDLFEIAERVSEAAENFGTLSVLDVRNGVATHTLNGYQFSIDGKLSGFTLEDLGSNESVTKDVKVELKSGKITISAHDLPLRYGGALAWVLDTQIAPMVDSGARNLAGLLRRNIDCNEVGTMLEPTLSFFSASQIAGWCETGIDAGAELLLSELSKIDEHAALVMKAAGEAKGRADSSGNVDKFENGKWSGVLDFAGSEAMLVDGKATFTATRVSGPR